MTKEEKKTNFWQDFQLEVGPRTQKNCEKNSQK